MFDFVTKAIKSMVCDFGIKKIMFSWINLSGTERKENDFVVSSSHYFLVCVTLPGDQTKC